MEKLILFGEMDKWSVCIDFIQESYRDIAIIGLCDPQNGALAAESNAVMTVDDVLSSCRQGLADGIINLDASIPVWNEYFNIKGIKKSYAISSRLYGNRKPANDMSAEIFEEYGKIKPELQHLEFHLADHCNLKCKGCSRQSNLRIL